MSLGLEKIELSFDKHKEIGEEGKNSKVFLANDEQLKSQKVVKMVEKKKFSNFDEYYSEAQKIEASRHPNVVEVKCAGTSTGHVCMIMPYYPRGSIKTLIKNKFLTVAQIIKYSIDFLAGLQHIHDQGLIHFDIKPDNILISDNNTALVSDFGITKQLNHLNVAIVTDAYPKTIPPDVFKYPTHTTAYDIYMAGGTMFHMCNGLDSVNRHFNLLKGNRSNFEKTVLNGRFPDRQNFLPHIPNSLRLIIKKAMNVNRDLRYKSALELSNAISNVSQLLHWQYEPLSNKWVLDRTDKIIEVHTIQHGQTWEIRTSKTMKQSGLTQKIGDYCAVGITAADLNKKVQNSLLELEL